MTSHVLLAKTFAYIFGWHLHSESEKGINIDINNLENECIDGFGVHSTGSVATPLNINGKG